MTWTYRVTTSSPTPLSGVTVVDDNGTPGNPADDLQPTYQSGDANADGLLEQAETWIFTLTGTPHLDTS